MCVALPHRLQAKRKAVIRAREDAAAKRKADAKEQQEEHIRRKQQRRQARDQAASGGGAAAAAAEEAAAEAAHVQAPAPAAPAPFTIGIMNRCGGAWAHALCALYATVGFVNVAA